MMAGNFYPNIEVNPRDHVQPDEKYDLKSLSNYKGLSKMKTFLGGEGRNTIPIKERVEKHVNKMLEIARNVKARVRAKKEAEEKDKSVEQDEKSAKEKLLERKATGWNDK